MQQIKSKVNGSITHIIQRVDDIQSERDNLVDDKEFLQVSSHKLPVKKFRAHYHFCKDASEHWQITQEAWVVIAGAVKFTAYDVDNTLLEQHDLFPGDCVICLYGGHNYEVLEPNTIVYEFKTGPYDGVANDKDFIND